jgi:hypothetical protein
MTGCKPLFRRGKNVVMEKIDNVNRLTVHWATEHFNADAKQQKRACEHLQPKIQHTHSVVRKASGHFISLTIPANLKYTATSTIGLHQASIFNRPDVKALVEWPACEILPIRTKGHRIHRFTASMPRGVVTKRPCFTTRRQQYRFESKKEIDPHNKYFQGHQKQIVVLSITCGVWD